MDGLRGESERESNGSIGKRAGTIDSRSKTKKTGDGGVDQINDEIRDGVDFSSNGSGKKSHLMEKSIQDSLKDAMHNFTKEETPGRDTVKIKN